MKYQVNDIISIWVDDFPDENYGYWLGVIIRCDQDYYRVKWLAMANSHNKLEDTYRAGACDVYTDMRLYHRNL